MPASSRAIAADPEAVWSHTNRANTIAIVSDGSRVLGLGDHRLGGVRGLVPGIAEHPGAELAVRVADHGTCPQHAGLLVDRGVDPGDLTTGRLGGEAVEGRLHTQTPPDETRAIGGDRERQPHRAEVREREDALAWHDGLADHRTSLDQRAIEGSADQQAGGGVTGLLDGHLHAAFCDYHAHAVMAVD